MQKEIKRVHATEIPSQREAQVPKNDVQVEAEVVDPIKKKSSVQSGKNTIMKDTPTGFALIPAGVFQMGDALDGIAGAPVRQVNVSSFYMAQHEMTKGGWDVTRDWGLSNGYTDLPIGGGSSNNHPVEEVSWFDVIKWCNARSEKEGLTPCYTVGGRPLRTGITIPVVNWTANGYRLPTEAEWEKAGRGGLNGKRFPWGDTISHDEANYQSDSDYAYDISSTRGFYANWDSNGNPPGSSSVGEFEANGYGLHNMAGNLREFCWDLYGGYASGVQTDPKGASSGSDRVIRGGAWYDFASDCRVGKRRAQAPTLRTNHPLGFRLARGL